VFSENAGKTIDSLNPEFVFGFLLAGLLVSACSLLVFC